MVSAAIAAVWGFGLSRAQAVGIAWPLLFAGAWSTLLLLSYRRGAPAVGILCVALGGYPIVDRLASDVLHGRTRQMKWIAWLDANRIPRMQLAPDFPVVERKTLSGLTIYETLFSQYETPLPATPYFNRYLELRKPGDLRGGFRNTSRQPYPLYGYKADFGTSVPDE